MTKKKSMSVEEKIKENPWILSTLVFGILAIVLLITSIFGSMNIGSDRAGENFVDYINSRGGAQIEYVDSKAYGPNLYEVIVLADGKEVPAHITQDGRYFVQVISALIEEEVKETSEPTQEVVKADLPVAELFVMTHCPFGTQAEKGFIPFVKAMGETIDAKIRFVHYYMHTNSQEEVETPRQVCIREEQGDLFLDYLTCFLGGSAGTPAEALACEVEVGIDSVALADCIDTGRGEEYYQEDSQLSESYGVRGSPTLVLNGEIISSGRSAAAYLDTVCQGFNEVPELCGEELDSTNPSAGFGYNAGGSASSASCG